MSSFSLRGWSSLTNCGCYIFNDDQILYLPQVQVKAHTRILATTSRTNLTQTFINPTNNTIEELRYVFPLYDGVSVVAFTCTVGSKTIRGVVKERQKAQQDYNEAIAKGQVAGLFKQSLEAADTFTTTIGNVPAGEEVRVDITYLGELKHDAQVDGIRFTMPTQIVPRYGVAESLDASNITQQGFSFTIDAEMPEGSSIKSIQSPSHPLSIEIGTTSTTKSQEPSLRRASATLQKGETHLDHDFIVQVVATKLGEPSAILETHPDYPHQRAIMTTLVPKFKLPAEKPEIVFICDRSGSMSGQISNLRTALEVFLKSIPVGVKFNICSFGTDFSFLWERSQTYGQETLDKAIKHIRNFQADYGGTQMYGPFEATFKKRYKDMNLEVFLLTDGEIWDQDRLFNLINDEVAKSKGTARVFTLGIGAGASTSLIEGIARAGNGFSQTVGDDEKMDKKVVRMLRGALFPHITDYSLEIKYGREQAPANDDFELVEKVMDGLHIDTAKVAGEETRDDQVSKKPVSLFDSSIENDCDDINMTDAPVVDNKFDHLPNVSIPHYLQTPGRIPPLFPFNRTTVYVLLSDATPNLRPKSIFLKGTSRHGPLELEIPITELLEKDTVIHCLAARREVKELEEGRGWLVHAKDSEGKLLKEKHDGHFSDMVEREAVRLGVKFQVGGKWCSFVAVEDDGEEREVEQVEGDAFRNYIEMKKPGNMAQNFQVCARAIPQGSTQGSTAMFGYAGVSKKKSRKRSVDSPKTPALPLLAKKAGRLFGSSGGSSSTGGGLFGAAPGASPSTSGGLFGATQVAPSGAGPGSLFSNSHKSSSDNSNPVMFGAPRASSTYSPTVGATALVSLPAPVENAVLTQYTGDTQSAAAMQLAEEAEESEDDMGYALFDDGLPPAPAPKAIQDMEPLQALTSLQTFSGSWSWSADLEHVLGVTFEEISKLDVPSTVTNHAEKNNILATSCAVLFFKRKLNEEEDVWEMLVEKAEGWLEDNIGDDGIKELQNVLEKVF
ncbi:hypothetical protein ACLX1H_000042 [Fusarium chlamydosporum]